MELAAAERKQPTRTCPRVLAVRARVLTGRRERTGTRAGLRGRRQPAPPRTPRIDDADGGGAGARRTGRKEARTAGGRPAARSSRRGGSKLKTR